MKVAEGCARGVVVIALLWIAGCGGGGGPSDAGSGGDAGAAGSAGSGAISGEGGSGGMAGEAGTGGNAGNAGSGGNAGSAGQDDDAGDEPDASETTDAGHDTAVPLLANGVACSEANACESGFCVDGVCCNQACDGACEACAASATGGDDGACGAVIADTDPDDECTMDSCMIGVCDGAGACAAIADGTECRPALGVCDSAETCAAGVCPNDQRISAGTECRAARGECDVAEACDGSAVECPTDALASAQVMCREALGVCDLAEYCTGFGDHCPGNALSAMGVECRASAGVCDVAEACTGGSVNCPTDAHVPQGATCRMSQGPCDIADACDGITPTCPNDAKAITVCRGAAGTCDVVEFCDGVNNTCPNNTFASADSTACGVQHCTGASAACVACRNDNDCNEGQRCASSNACVVPKLVFSTSTTQNGNLGGLAGADAVCQTRADAVGLPGTYKAWLSTSTVSAASRLTHATAPYYMLNGTKIADDWNDLIDGSLDAGITATEYGTVVPNNRPYTGTAADGSSGGAMCTNWTSASSMITGLMGQSVATNSGWSATVYLACNTLARLICLQQ